MLIPPSRPAALRALVAALALGCGAGWANSLQEASKLLHTGQHAQALEHVNKALAANPRDPQARFLKGLILTEQGNSKEAEDVFVKLTRDHPEYPEPHNNLAVIYASQGQYDKARAALESAIRTHPSYATAYDNLGGVYAKLASQAYDKALQTGSANAGALQKLVLVREMSGAAPPSARTATAGKVAPAQTVAAAIQPATPAPQAQAAAQAKPIAAATPVQATKAAPSALDAVNAWAKAWSSKDADAYLAFYAKDFVTPGGVSRADWEKARRQRIAAPKTISVTVESPRVTQASDSQASVTFRQGYRSDSLKASANKTLLMVKADDRWLIQQEKVGR